MYATRARLPAAVSTRIFGCVGCRANERDLFDRVPFASPQPVDLFARHDHVMSSGSIRRSSAGHQPSTFV